MSNTQQNADQESHANWQLAIGTGQSAAPAMLSFDVEEYFHVEAAATRLDRARWEAMPRRADAMVQRILDLLQIHKASATFFVLGWVARHEPQIVKRIVQAGMPVASHGSGHQMLTGLTPRQFRADLLQSRKLLEDLAGQPVLGYRAPTFSLLHKTAWAIDVLADAGFAYDSSIFPVRHDRYGVPEAPTDAHVAIGPEGGRILEIPPLTLRLPGMNFPAAGGGYLRLLPAGVISRALRQARRQDRCAMIYLHPWELDPQQPDLPMGRVSRWRQRINLHKTHARLDRLMGDASFASVESQLTLLGQRAKGNAFRYGT